MVLASLVHMQSISLRRLHLEEDDLAMVCAHKSKQAVGVATAGPIKETAARARETSDSCMVTVLFEIKILSMWVKIFVYISKIKITKTRSAKTVNYSKVLIFKIPQDQETFLPGGQTRFCQFICEPASIFRYLHEKVRQPTCYSS